MTLTFRFFYVWDGRGAMHVSCVFPNGDSYVGECNTSAFGLVRNGTGNYILASGVIYMGEWRDDKMQGRGIVKHPSGAMYEGEIKDNMYHGMGTYTFPDGSVYRGPFHMNRCEGEGTFIDGQGRVWAGEFHGKAAFGLKLQQNSLAKTGSI
ncbi:MORN repeat-containing protein 2 [Cololabis saira]|uniref:MORN repeat-containing protein 2 n=1 Tax=Cololabis saira TaxID=129043 RepID=UPI002AD31198|nr:MORN repeat-containing protein 2 [Cololabis saira]